MKIVFFNCKNLKQLVIPETVQYIPHSELMKLPQLEELTISSQYELH